MSSGVVIYEKVISQGCKAFATGAAYTTITSGQLFLQKHTYDGSKMVHSAVTVKGRTAFQRAAVLLQD